MSRRELDGLSSRLDGLAWEPRTPTQRDHLEQWDKAAPRTVKKKPAARPPTARPAIPKAKRAPRFPPPSTPPRQQALADISNDQGGELVVFTRNSSPKDSDQTLIKRPSDTVVLPKNLPVNRYSRSHPTGSLKYQPIANSPFVERLQITSSPFVERLQIEWKPPSKSELSVVDSPVRPRYPTLNPAAYFIPRQPKTLLQIGSDVTPPPNRQVNQLFGTPNERTTPLIFEPRRPPRTQKAPNKNWNR